MPMALPTAISSPPETRFISRIPLGVASLCRAAATAAPIPRFSANGISADMTTITATSAPRNYPTSKNPGSTVT